VVIVTRIRVLPAGVARAVTGNDGYVLLTTTAGETYRFLPGADALELAHTGGPGWRAAFESLHTPAHVAAWLDGYLAGESRAGPGLHPDGPAASARERSAAAAPHPGVAGPITAGDLHETLALRDALWVALDARMAGDPLPGPALEVVNAHAADRSVTWHVTADGRRVRTTPVTVAQVLATCAADAVDLLTGPADRLRQCEAGDCFLVFLDTSRSGRRRWCSMERCGNRAKVASFRSRHRQEDRA
jgi:predicted RNA-binding Zn ribbon-like protein